MNAIASAACPPLAAQTVLVTGGARGLGRAISEAYKFDSNKSFKRKRIEIGRAHV